MSVTVHNPYSGKDEETCSVSFAAQQKVVGGVSSPQTEAEYHKSKLSGEWGVIQGKVFKGEIPDGTKVLTFKTINGTHGYVKVEDGSLTKVMYFPDGDREESPMTNATFKTWMESKHYEVAIPKVSPAASTPTPAVNPGSDSVGSMSNEDVSAMFVKIKDDLAKEKGLNIKGSNPDLDELVYNTIGDKIGYTGPEVKAKIDAYKADGNKLSALKKKVLLGTKKVPDPKPNAVPTKVTATVTNAAKEAVKETVEAKPTKVYSNEDIAAQYIIAKDAIVAGSNGKWTLYTKSDELEADIYSVIKSKTGYDMLQAKQALAEYLGSGKKLSVLKKQLAKQGAFEPKADTLKKSGTDKTLADKEKEVGEKADAGYTPTPTPSSAGDPPVATGKPAPERVKREAAQSGDISGIKDVVKKDVFKEFKAFGHKSYLSSTTGQNYEAVAGVQKELKNFNLDLSLLQILRIIDEEGAKKAGVENGKLFEKKVATWLTTPEGTNYIKSAEIKIAAEAAKKAAAAELEKIAKELEANQPPLPPDSNLFQPWDLDKAKRISKTWLDAKPWSDREKRDLTHYTGSSYHEMNGHLRSGETSAISERSKNAIVGAKAGMRPTTEPILVQRGTGLSQFESLGVQHGDASLVWAITGKTFKDEGFLSTSAGGRAAFGGEAILEIECPTGTPMAYVAPISRYPHENEMLLQAGMEYKVLNVRKEGYKFIVRMRVVNWLGKE